MDSPYVAARKKSNQQIGGALSGAADMLMTPLNLGAFHAARSGDVVANMIADIMGRARENPNEQADKTMPALARSFDAFKRAGNDVSAGVSGFADWLGWKEKNPQPNQSQAPSLPSVPQTAPRSVPMAQPSVTWKHPSAGALPQSPAIPQTTPVPQTTVMPSSPAPGALNGQSEQNEVPTTDAPAQSERRSLADEFRERMAGIQRPDAALTPEQKKMAMLESALAMLAASSKPGAKALGAFGEAGMRGTAMMREQEKQNRIVGDNDYRSKLDTLAKEMGFINVDEDNKRADKQTDINNRRLDETERRNRAQEALMAKARDLQLQVAQGRLTQQQAMLELQKERLAIQQERGEKEDPLTKSIKGLQDLYRSQGRDVTIEDVLRQIKGAPRDEAGEKDVLKIAQDILKNDMSGRKTPAQAADEARQLLSAARGAPSSAKPDPAAHNGKTIVGPDGKFKSNGKEWVKVQ